MSQWKVFSEIFQRNNVTLSGRGSCCSVYLSCKEVMKNLLLSYIKTYLSTLTLRGSWTCKIKKLWDHASSDTLVSKYTGSDQSVSYKEQLVITSLCVCVVVFWAYVCKSWVKKFFPLEGSIMYLFYLYSWCGLTWSVGQVKWLLYQNWRVFLDRMTLFKTYCRLT